jgi:catechol 2,3-dioxygenase-like lactoylglutathione lyase family enzyme
MADALPQLDLYTTILRVKDIQRSVAWYCDVLGLHPERNDSTYRLMTLVSSSGQRLTLREIDKEHVIVPSGLFGSYVVFITSDANATYAQMTARGQKVSSIQDHPGVRLFWIYDPDDHPLCILQFVIDWNL